MKYVVELEENVWIAPWEGDPGRTVVKTNAEIFTCKVKAKLAITYARLFRPFKQARIVKL